MLIPKSLDSIKEQNIREQFEHDRENAMQDILELEDTPTADVPLLEDKQAGMYSSVLYWRSGNVIYYYTPTGTITVT